MSIRHNMREWGEVSSHGRASTWVGLSTVAVISLLFGPGDLEDKIDGPARYVVRGDGSQKKLRLPKSVARNLGDNPLIMKVQKVGGEFFTDVVLRPEQVEQLRQAQPGDLLSLGKLFIIQTRSIDVSES